MEIRVASVLPAEPGPLLAVAWLPPALSHAGGPAAPQCGAGCGGPERWAEGPAAARGGAESRDPGGGTRRATAGARLSGGAQILPAAVGRAAGNFARWEGARPPLPGGRWPQGARAGEMRQPERLPNPPSAAGTGRAARAARFSPLSARRLRREQQPGVVRGRSPRWDCGGILFRGQAPKPSPLLQVLPLVTEDGRCLSENSDSENSA